MAGPHARVRDSGGKTRRHARGRGGTAEALARRVNRAILRDRYGTYSRAGIAPLPVRAIARGVTYRRPTPAGKAVR